MGEKNHLNCSWLKTNNFRKNSLQGTDIIQKGAQTDTKIQGKVLRVEPLFFKQ